MNHKVEYPLEGVRTVPPSAKKKILLEGEEALN